MSDFTIRPYAHTDEDAAKLAVMWNESDDQWPGTFTDGVPFTAERVREWMGREKGLSNLVIDDPARERIVGYGSLWKEHDKQNACYLPLLNVHPAYQRRSLARRLILQMIDQAVELGYHLMTIGTWPGNLKSVPLYKKVGFFWVPDTNVHMDNLIPLIRQLPVAARYFQKHDWYTTFKRELRQVEDDERHGAMKVYHYHWEADGDRLSVLIDREAKTVTGLETDDFAAYAELDDVEPAHGLPYPIRWRVINKRDEPVNVSILASGDPGITISQQSALVLQGGQEEVIQGHFTVSPDIKPVKKDWPAPRINTVLVVGGDVVELGSGVRSRPAVEISAEPSYPVLLPGRPQTVHVQLRNRINRPLRGVVSLAPDSAFKADWEGLRRDFSLDAEGFAGLPLTVTCDGPGTVPLRFNANFEVDDVQVRARTQRVPLFSLPPGGVVADLDEGGDEGQLIVVENELFRLRCRSEGGRCEVWDKVENRPAGSVRDELGPPFVPSELWYKHYDLSLEREAGQVKAILSARSNNFPGLTLTKEITLSASPLMTLRYFVSNEGTHPHTFQLNPRVWLGDRERARITLPRAERLVRERAALFSAIHGDVPEEPEGLAQRWLAWRAGDFVVGLIWDDSVEKQRWNWSFVSFNRPSHTLEPGGTLETPPFYVYAGPGDWADVRRAWARLSDQEPEIVRDRVRPERKLKFGLAPSPIISLGDRVEATLRADNIREQALDGQIIVEPPAGWRVEPDAFRFEDLKKEQPLVGTVQLRAQGGQTGAQTGQLYFESDRFDVAEPFTVIRLGDETSPVNVTESSEEEQPVFIVDNGHSRWKIAPAYHAGVVSWSNGDDETNHLCSPFPREGGGELGWLKPWFGGVWPILNIDDVEAEGWPGKLHEEQFTPQPLERVDERGIQWQGLRLSAQVRREAFRGLRVEIAYLTVGGSNLLKAVYRLVNETDVYWRAVPGFFAFCQVDGRYDNGILYGDGVQRKRTPVMAWPDVGSWGAVTNPETGRTLVLVNETAGTSLELADWGKDGGHLLSYRRAFIPPQGQNELVVYLALTGSLEEARRYASLAA